MNPKVHGRQMLAGFFILQGDTRDMEEGRGSDSN